MNNFSHLFKFYFAVHNYSFNRYWELIIWPTLIHSVNEHQKTCQNRGSKILFNFSFFHLYTHRPRKLCSHCWHYIFFVSVFLLPLFFFFFFLVSMKDSCSHLTKMWAWLKAIRTTEFSKKLIVFNLTKASQCTRHNQFRRWKDSIFQIKRKKFFIA